MPPAPPSLLIALLLCLPPSKLFLSLPGPLPLPLSGIWVPPARPSFYCKFILLLLLGLAIRSVLLSLPTACVMPKLAGPFRHRPGESGFPLQGLIGIHGSFPSRSSLCPHSSRRPRPNWPHTWALWIHQEEFLASDTRWDRHFGGTCSVYRGKNRVGW